MALPFVATALGGMAKITSSIGGVFAIAKYVIGIMTVIAVVRALMAVIVGLLSYAFLPTVLEALPDLFIPGDLQSRIGPTFLFIMDLVALDVCLQIFFSALTSRFVLRRLT